MRSILVIAVSVSGLFAVESTGSASTVKQSTVVYTIKGNVQDAYYTMMDKPVKALGYRLPDPPKIKNEWIFLTS